MKKVVKISTNQKPAPRPRQLIMPCEFGLINKLTEMEHQLGTVNAYNMLCSYADKLRLRIESGDIKQADSFFTEDPIGSGAKFSPKWLAILNGEANN